MKISAMLAVAGLTFATLGTATLAHAQDYRDRQYQDQRGDQQYEGDRGDREDRGDRGYRDQNYRDRHDERDYRGDRRDRYRTDWRRRYNRCHIEWRYHRRVRICR